MLINDKSINRKAHDTLYYKHKVVSSMQSVMSAFLSVKIDSLRPQNSFDFW